MPEISALVPETDYFFILAKIMLNIFLAVLISSIVIIIGYYLYQNIPGEPENIEVVAEPMRLETGNLSYEIRQFYPNMKFNHNSISYAINSDCSTEKKQRMLEAFGELSGEIRIINFYPKDENPDIEVSCSEYVNKEEKDYFIAGEGGAREIIQTGRYNVITQGIILLHSNPNNAYKCEWANIELHELLHVFGFDHSEDKESLMYSYLKSCTQKLDESIINDLKELYSQENLADLYFEKTTAIKKGRYLDFNVTVRNSGTISVGNAILSVFDGAEKLENFELNEISFGAGANLQIINLRLNSRSSDNIKIIIDVDNLIKEIDEDNNVAELKFN